MVTAVELWKDMVGWSGRSVKKLWGCVGWRICPLSAEKVLTFGWTAVAGDRGLRERQLTVDGSGWRELTRERKKELWDEALAGVVDGMGHRRHP